MTLRNFAPSTTPTRQSKPLAPKVILTESLSVTQLASQSHTDLLTDPDNWGWSELRDYVVTAIEVRFGTFPRDAKKEASIFGRFVKEHGPAAAKIARYAFEDCDGWWMNAPVSVNRFCKGSDDWFAAPIKVRLAETI